MSKLEYQAHVAIVVEQDSGVTRIIVPMQGPYAPVPRLVAELGLLAFAVAPIWWGATLVIRTCLRLSKPPRAVFEVTRGQVTMALRDPVSGEASVCVWSRSAIAEARMNRYEPGLWISVAGHVQETYLADLPREVLERLEAALAAALAEPPKGDISTHR